MNKPSQQKKLFPQMSNYCFNCACEESYLMDLIHSSFSSGVGADILYTTWLPSTTRPSASVLQALITWPL